MKQPTLAELTTMRIGGSVDHYRVVHTKSDLETIIDEAHQQQLPHFVIGGGSNIIATDKGYNGILIKNEMLGFEVTHEDDGYTTITIGAGENWDEIVKKTVEMNLSGIEAMSAIPGTVGATPVQNVGAYGQEIADTLQSLEAYDSEAQQWATLSAKDCQFGYRDSAFKDPTTRHHIIASITIRLSKAPMKPPFYASLTHYLDSHAIVDRSPASIRRAVINIRRNKLPDPKKIANSGSFFKNPIVDASVADRLLAMYPHMPTFPAGNDRTKLAAGWLIEQSGLRGYNAFGFKTYEHNALVVVNESSHSYIDLVAFRNHIVTTVKKKFSVTLEQEPELLQSQT